MIKIALIGCFVGLIILFFLSQSMAPEKVGISEAYKKDIDDWVVISGKINWTKNYEGITLFRVCDDECISVIAYEEINIKTGSLVEVVGKIKMYKGKKEIQAEKISLLQ